jgi:hypothetical protein
VPTYCPGSESRGGRAKACESSVGCERPMDVFEVSLPRDLAEQLVQEGVARRGLGQRGDWVGFATLAANATSALATVLVNWDDLRALAARFAAHARDEVGDQPALTVTVRVEEESRSLAEANDAEGVSRIEVQVSQILSSHRPPSAS